jgi:hypothetical protein
MDVAAGNRPPDAVGRGCGAVRRSRRGDVMAQQKRGLGKGLGALIPTAPDPVTRDSRVSFRLSRDGDATLELLDVTGRALRRLASGSYAAGEHSLTLGRDVSGVVEGVGRNVTDVKVGDEVYALLDRDHGGPFRARDQLHRVLRQANVLAPFTDGFH